MIVTEVSKQAFLTFKRGNFTHEVQFTHHKEYSAASKFNIMSAVALRLWLKTLNFGFEVWKRGILGLKPELHNGKCRIQCFGSLTYTRG